MTLADIIAHIESGVNYGAMRFEPHVMGSRYLSAPLLARTSRINRCSTDTARMICSTSWGAWQIMGFNLYSAPLSMHLSIPQFLDDEEAQLALFWKYVDARDISLAPRELKVQKNRERFARVYNGPGNVPAYSAKILDTIERLEKEQS